jgi:hypothetical protein
MSDMAEDLAYCNRRAEHFRRMVAQETDLKLKQSFADMEDRWLRLADCYRYPKSINALRAALAAEHAGNM